MIQDLVKKLELIPHGNGGFFKETHRDEFQVKRTNGEERSASTCITVLLPGDAYSGLHFVKSDELYHFYLGSTKLVVVEFFENSWKKTVMGSDLLNGEVCQYVFKKGVTWGSYCLSSSSDDYVLFGATVAPGFDFEDFTVVKPEDLLKKFPDARQELKRLGLNE